MNGRLRLAHLVSHPIPYFAPLYRELSRRPEVDLTVYYYSDASIRPHHDTGFGRTVDWNLPLLDGYRSVILPSARRTPIGGGFFRRRNLDLIVKLWRNRYDVVWIHGYAHLTAWLAVLVARLRGTRILIREEQTLLAPRPWWRRILKELPLRLLFSQCDGVYIGEENRRYFERYGLPARRLYAARYCVDGESLEMWAEAPRNDAGLFRRNLGIDPSTPVVLYVGKLLENKNVSTLIRAFARVRREHECALALIGDGPLRSDLSSLVERIGIPDVHFAGFLGPSQVPRAYLAADVFALPSSETWGLVVNEAMTFGLPVVVSERVGCAADLVVDNGFVVSHADEEALARALGTLVADESLRAAMGSRSRSRISAYTVARCADGIVSACYGGVPSREALVQ